MSTPRPATLVLVLLALGGGFFAGRRFSHPPAPAPAATAAKKQLWTCSMHPQVIRDEPGLCPICHMKLEPLETAGKDGKGEMVERLTIDPVVVQNMGIRVARVSTGPLRRIVRAVGILEEAQPLIRDVNLRVSGWIEKLHAATEGQRVAKGEPLFELYSPELIVAAGELVAARRSGTAADVAAAERKLANYGIDPEETRAIATAAVPPRTVTFRSPISGDVIEKLVVEGAAVKAGDRALRIVDHSTLWLDVRVYPQDVPFIKLGQKIRATVETRPGEEFEGEVIFIHPHVDPTTRTATVRMALANPTLTLRPGTFATAEIAAVLAEETTLVPREAVIDTGTRQIVFVSLGEGRFEPRRVKVGPTSDDGRIQIIEGLIPGDVAVTSGQFLLDAESRIREAIQKHLHDHLLAPPEAARVAGRGHAHDAAPAAPPAEPPAAPAMPWSPEVDALFREYLALGRGLADAPKDGPPVPPAAFVATAKALADAAPASARALAHAVHEAALALEQVPLSEQRRRFKAASASTIALARARPPSPAVAAKLFVIYCSMENARWLQASDAIVNPYDPEMRGCGEVERTIGAQP